MSLKSCSEERQRDRRTVRSRKIIAHHQLQSGVKMETGSISRKIERGKHTTRHSELIVLEEGSYIMDTPGFSSLYVGDIEKEELKYCFPEFSAYEGKCRFNGCSHTHEPDARFGKPWKKGRYTECGTRIIHFCTVNFRRKRGIKKEGYICRIFWRRPCCRLILQFLGTA